MIVRVVKRCIRLDKNACFGTRTQFRWRSSATTGMKARAAKKVDAKIKAAEQRGKNKKGNNEGLIQKKKKSTELRGPLV
eukprot:TRINITY_DN3891_c0_g1_i1.p1 TRINITY_DN3891_c0_g1~~TRINITY_DN3891_c0_g1_i1.p1  ORF type:complete len:79 (+),score=17.76 TRINITY_DN3891_c0_g1_i1:81-317(+)